MRPYHYADDNQQPLGQLIRHDELAALAGVANHTIRRLCRREILPPAICTDRDGYTLFDSADPVIVAWLESLGRSL